MKKIKVYHIGEDGVLEIKQYPYEKLYHKDKKLLRIKTDKGYKYVPINAVATRKRLGFLSEEFIIIDERNVTVFEDENIKRIHELELFQHMFKGIGKLDVTQLFLAIGSGIAIGLFLSLLIGG